MHACVFVCVKTLEPGDCVFNEGETQRYIYLVESGTLRMEKNVKGTAMALAQLQPVSESSPE